VKTLFSIDWKTKIEKVTGSTSKSFEKIREYLTRSRL